jgi:hypothetical protein
MGVNDVLRQDGDEEDEGYDQQRVEKDHGSASKGLSPHVRRWPFFGGLQGRDPVRSPAVDESQTG